MKCNLLITVFSVAGALAAPANLTAPNDDHSTFDFTPFNDPSNTWFNWTAFNDHHTFDPTAFNDHRTSNLTKRGSDNIPWHDGWGQVGLGFFSLYLGIQSDYHFFEIPHNHHSWLRMQVQFKGNKGAVGLVNQRLSCGNERQVFKTADWWKEYRMLGLPSSVWIWPGNQCSKFPWLGKRFQFHHTIVWYRGLRLHIDDSPYCNSADNTVWHVHKRCIIPIWPPEPHAAEPHPPLPNPPEHPHQRPPQ